MYCDHCGAEVSEQSIYCRTCGNKLSESVLQENEHDIETQTLLGSTQLVVDPNNVSDTSIDWFSRVVLFSCSITLIIELILAYQTNLLGSAIAALSQGIKNNSIQKMGTSFEITYWISIITGVATLILFLIWIYKSYEKLQNFHPMSEIRFSPGWAVGWFFVPFANLYKPFQIIRELFSKSQPSNASFAFRNGTLITSVWWILFLINNIMSRFLDRNEGRLNISSPNFLKDFHSHLEAVTINEVINIASVLTMSFIIYKISKMLSIRQSEAENRDILK